MSRIRRVLRGVRQRAWRARAALRRRRAAGPQAPVVGVAGPGWLVDLLRGSARISTPDVPAMDRPPEVVIVGPGGEQDAASPEAWPGVPRVGYRVALEPALDPAAVVDGRRSNPTRRFVPETAPADVRAAARAAGRVVDGGSPSSGRPATYVPWLEATVDAHETYRLAHRRTTDALLADALRLAGGQADPEPDEEVTVVCVTNRPELFDAVLANYERQLHPQKRLLVVANDDRFDLVDLRARIAGLDAAAALQVPEVESLGTCLNVALDTSETRFVAKFDDDDHYGAAFLSDLVLAHRFAQAAVVGKHSYFAEVDGLPDRYLRFPGREFEHTSFVAGGTLVIDRERVPGVRFPDRSVGEDQGFLDACQRAGESVYAADRFNYLQRRGSANTWQPGDAFLRGAIPLDPSSRAATVEL